MKTTMKVKATTLSAILVLCLIASHAFAQDRLKSSSKKTAESNTKNELTLDAAHSLIVSGKGNSIIGRKVSWLMAPHKEATLAILLGKSLSKYDENYRALEGYMWIVPSTGAKAFAIKVSEHVSLPPINENEKKKFEAAKSLIKKGALVSGTVGGVYTNEKLKGDKAMPFLTSWHVGDVPK